jgi:hypothetical protein
MERFFGERIEVKKDAMSPDPVSFKWRGEVHDVLPPRSRKWYMRRHRRYYVIRDSEGDVFEIYLDYADRKKQTWWLVKRLEEKNDKS